MPSFQGEAVLLTESAHGQDLSFGSVTGSGRLSVISLKDQGAFQIAIAYRVILSNASHNIVLVF